MQNAASLVFYKYCSFTQWTHVTSRIEYLILTYNIIVLIVMHYV